MDIDEHEVDSTEYTEESLLQLKAMKVSWRDKLYGRHALEQARSARIFADDVVDWPTSGDDNVEVATGDALRKLSEWKHMLDSDTYAQHGGAERATLQDNGGSVQCLRERAEVDHMRDFAISID